MECTEQMRSRELANSSSFHRSLFSEIEEVGWEHLVNLAGDLKFLSFRVIDKKGRVHILEVQLDNCYPKCPPSVSADVPYIFNLKWSVNSRLKDLVQQFQEHLEKLQDIWSTLDDIDSSLCVVDLNQPPRAMSFRQIDIGNDCFIMLFINVKDPRSLPECRFLGSGQTVNSMRNLWQQNSKRWMKEKTFLENLTFILETQLPKPLGDQKNDQQVECGICYAQCLPVDDEFGPRSGTGTDYTCDNSNCNRAFHSVCLGDWLRSITTTRQQHTSTLFQKLGLFKREQYFVAPDTDEEWPPLVAWERACMSDCYQKFSTLPTGDTHRERSFDVLFGNCPYCSEPVAVKVNNAKNILIDADRESVTALEWGTM